MATYVFKSDQYGTHKLNYLPIGWDRFTRSLERSKEWQSVSPNFDIDLTFIEDGAEYLIGAYEDSGVDAQVFLDIYMDDEQDLRHKPVPVRTKIDFTSYTVNHQGHVKVDVERIGFAQKLKNGERVKVDLTSTRPLEGTFELPQLPFRNIALHSKGILKLTEMRYKNEGTDNIKFELYRSIRDSTFGGANNYADYYTKYVTISTIEKVSEEIEQSFERETRLFTDGFPARDNETPIGLKRRIFDFTEAGTTNINVRVDITVSIEWYGILRQKSYLVIRRVRNGVESDLSRQFIANSGNPAGDEDRGSLIRLKKQIINLKKTAGVQTDILTGDEVYVYLETDVEHHSLDRNDGYTSTLIIENCTVNDYNISASNVTSVPASKAEAIPFADAFSRTVESLTGEVGSFDNSFYALTDTYHQTAPTDTIQGKRMLMNGIHIRGWGLGEKPLTVTLSDLFKTAYALDAVGFGVKEVEGKFKAYVAPIKDFYRDDVVLNLGVVDNLSKKVDLDKTYSTVETGYNKYDTDSTNSLDEFNGSREFKTHISAHNGNYEAISPFRGDGYGLETARRQDRLAAPNKSTPYDKDTFVVCFMRVSGNIVSEDGSIFTYSANLLDPDTAYNARISPARILRKHEPLFSGCLQKALDKDLKFTDGEVNLMMESRISGEPYNIAESGDKKNSTLAKPLYLNELYEFEKVLTEEQISLLEKDPHGTIAFRDEYENEKFGYLMNVEINYNRLAKFTLQRKYINGL